MQTIIRQEITNYQIEQIEIETTGDLKYLPKNATIVVADFGSFERTQNSTLVYSAVIERENGIIIHDFESEYADDYRLLRNGKVTVAA